MTNRVILPQNRTVLRSRGCFNCSHFETGDNVLAHFRACLERDKERLRQQHGGIIPVYNKLTGGPDRRFAAAEQWIATGAAGICHKKGHGGPGTDFVASGFLCDRWDPGTGASIATEGMPLDKLPDELLDIVDSKKS